MAGSTPKSPRAALIERLTGYWKLEAWNILLMPVAMTFLAGGKVGILSIVTMAAMMALLAIGAIYWRAKLHHIDRGVSPDSTIRQLAKLDMLMAFASVIAGAAVIAAWTMEGLAIGTADRWVTTVAGCLTVLEYINYYHRQLQHFDHAADWKRLMSGRGFRKSQLRQDIERLG
uniref:hypothetical protein n=1 Tax=uncultured Erythrobacter sp. TaxID=263913 RepID=UPI002628E74D|nr:hypothetical protein [uncultured Erythrobacter sp.]